MAGVPCLLLASVGRAVAHASVGIDDHAGQCVMLAWCRGVAISELKLAGETHGCRRRLCVVDLHIVAMWMEEAGGEQLDVLRLVETSRARY